MRAFFKALCLVSLLSFTAVPSHAISPKWLPILQWKGDSQNESMEELLSLAHRTLEEAFSVYERLTEEVQSNPSEAENAAIESARSSGKFFGMYVRRFFEQTIEERKYDADTLDKITYDYMKKATALSYTPQRQLINAMRDELKTLSFPVPKAMDPKQKRSLSRLNIIFKSLAAVGILYGLYDYTIYFDKNPVVVWGAIGSVVFGPEIFAGTVKTAGLIRNLFGRSLSKEAQRQLLAAQLASQEYRRAALPRDCSAILRAEHPDDPRLKKAN